MYKTGNICYLKCKIEIIRKNNFSKIKLLTLHMTEMLNFNWKGEIGRKDVG